MTIRDFFYRMKQGTEHLNYGGHIVLEWSEKHIEEKCKGETVRILDIGCGACRDMLNIRERSAGVNPELYGIDSSPVHCAKGPEIGVQIHNVDIERSPLPFEDSFFSIVIINNVLEHVKEIFWVVGEISRVLKHGGIFIIGVPNLAAFHNRVLLLFGGQPACIEVLGPHVRGFAYGSLKTFLETGGFFNVRSFRGSNFYPFPPAISMVLSGLFPSLSVSIFLNAERTEKNGNFVEILDNIQLETPFFKG